MDGFARRKLLLPLFAYGALAACSSSTNSGTSASDAADEADAGDASTISKTGDASGGVSPVGAACQTPFDCPGYTGIGHTVQCDTSKGTCCIEYASSYVCNAPSDCCEGQCQNKHCCQPTGGDCITGDQCCSGSCGSSYSCQ